MRSPSPSPTHSSPARRVLTPSPPPSSRRSQISDSPVPDWRPHAWFDANADPDDHSNDHLQFGSPAASQTSRQRSPTLSPTHERPETDCFSPQARPPSPPPLQRRRKRMVGNPNWVKGGTFSGASWRRDEPNKCRLWVTGTLQTSLLARSFLEAPTRCKCLQPDPSGTPQLASSYILAILKRVLRQQRFLSLNCQCRKDMSNSGLEPGSA